MNLALLSIIIIVVALILFAIPKIPMSITAILTMVVMGLTGIIDFKTAYAGFSNAVIFLVAGMFIMGQAFVKTGVAQRLGNLMFKFVGTSEKKFIVFTFIISSILGLFVSGAVPVSILMPIADCLVLKSRNGEFTRKRTYMAIGLAGPLGNNLTLTGAASMITCAALATEAGYRQMGMFEPTLVGLPALVVTVIFYVLFIHKWSYKWLDYPDPAIEGDVSVEDTESAEWKAAHPLWKQVVAVCSMLGAIIAIICGMNMGAAALCGTIVVVLTGCLSEKEAFRAVSWSTVVIAAAAIGFSSGLSKSGGGEMLANWFLNLFSFAADSPFGMTCVMFIIAGLISQVMADSGSVACTAPVAVAICQAKGWDPIPMLLCTAMGVKTALATPICVSCMTQVAPGGYRFKDYLKIGGIVTILQAVCILIMAYFVYF